MKRLIESLNRIDARIDAGDYKTATDDFRSKYTHRFTPRVELGITQMVKRLPSRESGKLCYGVGGSEPVRLETVVHELKVQSVRLAKGHGEFQKLVTEQSNSLFGMPAINFLR